MNLCPSARGGRCRVLGKPHLHSFLRSNNYLSVPKGGWPTARLGIFFRRADDFASSHFSEGSFVPFSEDLPGFLGVAVVGLLPGGLVARMDERVFVEPAEGRPRNIVRMCGLSSAVGEGARGCDGQRNRRGRAAGRTPGAGRAGAARLHRDHRHQVGPARRHGDRGPQPVEQDARSRERPVRQEARGTPGRGGSAWSRSTCFGLAVGSCLFPSTVSPKATARPMPPVPVAAGSHSRSSIYRLPLRERLPAIAIPLRTTTPTSRLISRPCSTSATRQAAMAMTSTTARSPIHHWSRRRRVG